MRNGSNGGDMSNYAESNKENTLHLHVKVSQLSLLL